MIDRRSFMGLGALAMCAIGAKAVSAASCCAETNGKVKFKFGMAGFSCHRLSLDETLKLMKKLDLPEHLSATALLDVLNALMSREEFYRLDC